MKVNKSKLKYWIKYFVLGTLFSFAFAFARGNLRYEIKIAFGIIAFILFIFVMKFSIKHENLLKEKLILK